MLEKADLIAREDIGQVMADIGARAKSAARTLAKADAERKHATLVGMADAVWRNRSAIIDANIIDMAAGEEKGLSDAFMDRLKLDDARIRGMVDGLKAIAEMRDPIGDVIAEWERPNGLNIQRVRTPLGVIGVIFESRPNVTADAGALCLKSGNAVILRGGSDSFHSSRAIHACLVDGLTKAGLPEDTIQIVPTTDRAAVDELLRGLNGCVDVIVPRGGKGLVGRVQEHARVPVFAHLEGLCHIYVDRSADAEMARSVVVNAKMRRTGICGAVETLLIDRSFVQREDSENLSSLLSGLRAAGCEIKADSEIQDMFPDVSPVEDADWSTEYLDSIISVKLVDGIEGAIEHIGRWSSSHTEAVIAEDPKVVERFFNEIDSAILLHNASTQFADGGEFGMGAEIGIATGKMHARGPVGIEQLTSFKYLVRGNGQTRP